ncbi:NAD(P)H-dependent glycerol-3-phosphate dehydrogenase [Ahrensia sp. R2A130]|uniref:NAD(P)H-dependent glycerol-3-phosphate dehydrogenase n=1 Tax=Ahrensia sp. R2A130 TaxID=744979 RepID=UPI0001E08CAE|nr:NAD(P)H-dependent glycerol-3-phosphate dehydrogenase [Ahrensia sp. R2A130]EFL88136.1 glycerol-3-phosphate dehydrogenase [NAD(P)+] [Ahrensia sp. R2A130]
MSIAVIGAGAWGTALAQGWAMEGKDVTLLARDEQAADAIRNAGENTRYLPGIPLSKDMAITGDPAALQGASIIAIVIPTQALRAVLNDVGKHIAADATLVLCAKGIERETLASPVDIVSETLPGRAIAVLSGPSFAHDVARRLPTAVTLAAQDDEKADALCANLSTRNLRLYASTDLVGVELGGALKNVMAVAVGITRGLKLGASAEAALIARGFAEMTRLAVARGANAETLTGLSGLGDLVLTCGSSQSRNFAYGEALAKGEDLSDRPLAEGVHTARQAQQLARQTNVDAPIIDMVCAILNGDLDATDAVRQLLSRPLTRETES